MNDVATVLGHVIERKAGTVHALLRTDHGPVRLRFTPADATVIGGELRVRAVQPAGEPRNHVAAAAAHLPLEKPGGGIG
jgi:hypothetical protein